MIEKLTEIKQSALKAISEGANSQDLEKIRIEFLGKKGRMTEVLHSLKDVAESDRPRLGQEINAVKVEITGLLDQKIQMLQSQEQNQKLLSEEIDITLPGIRNPLGRAHLITRTMEEIVAIFADLGFDQATGPDIENDFHNFEALNMPPKHPARDMWDTFYVDDGFLLRTHTSPVQIRTLLKQKPPVRIIAPGAVYRRDDDMTHAPVFHQVEGLVVDKNVNFAELKGVLQAFLKAIFPEDLAIRFRPSFFPFTEPSAEVDVQWGSGWLEILGCGMVDPNVLKAVNIDPEEYTGFAFGLGVERIAMLKYGIKDIRLFNQNDLRFLRQL